MNQILKISISRGACRFATPLYLGGKYDIRFAGERADECKTIVFTKCKAKDSFKLGQIAGLAVSVRDGDRLTLDLNKRVLVDYFKDSGQCDVDGFVYAHAYVFDHDGVVVCDADVSIEYRPVDFIVDEEEFASWENFRERIVALEAQGEEHKARLEAQDLKNLELEKTDAENLLKAAKDASEKAAQALLEAKTYADAIKDMVAKMQYIKCDVESSESSNVYHRIFVKLNSKGEHIIAIDDAPVSIEGGDPETTRYVYTDNNQEISGNKKFTGKTEVKTAESDSNDTTAASTAWVRSTLATQIALFKTALIAEAVTWTGVHTFSAGIVGNVTGNLTGNVTGNLTGNVTGDVTGNLTGGDASVVKLTVSGEETHTGDEVHKGEVSLENVKAPDFGSDFDSLESKAGINAAYAWAVLGKYCKYFGGLYRLFDADIPDFFISGTEATTDINSTAWREHDRQNGVFSWLARTVGVSSFIGNNSLSRIVMPNVVEVKNNAFKWGHELYTAVLPECKKIGDYAFSCPSADARYAYELRAIYAPNVEEIGSHAFEWNHALHCINEDVEATDFGTSRECGVVKFSKCVKVGDYAFYNAGIHNASRPYYLLRTVELPQCRYVGQYAFYDDAGYGIRPYKIVNIGHGLDTDGNPIPLGSVVDGVDTRNYIGEYAFFGSSDTGHGPLTKINCPRTQVFKDRCFSDCTYVTDLNIECAEEILPYAFYMLGAALSNASTFPDVGIEIPNCKTVNTYAFGNDNTDRYTFKWVNAPSLELAGSFSFYRHCNITKVNMPNVVTIKNDAFNRCLKLVCSYDEGGDKDWLEFPSCKTVEANAFYDCVALVTLKLNSVETIGASAFRNCNALTNLHVESMTTDAVLAQIGTWYLNGNCRVHAKNGSIIAYINNTWTVI